MGKKLIITEKPSVARDYARVLQVNGKQNGYIENDSYVISWCYGHLVSMLYPESYDPSLEKWRLDDLPFLPKDYLYGVIESAKDQYNVVNGLLHREDIDTVLWAGDSGKEGQTIEENIRHYGGVREGMTELRVWIDSQTDDEILRGIREAKPMSDYDLLGRSGVMRAIEDYSLGINFSRVLTLKYARMLNDAAATQNYTAIAVGRVMTCVLGMVVNREREIRNFTETPFYRIMGQFSEAGFLGEWKTTEQSKYLDSPLLYKENGFKKEEDANKLIEELTGKKAVITNLETGISKKRAPLLFNLAELQSECSKIFKISPKETLDTIQDLYEKKMTTYPRTDARVLTTAVAKEISKNLYGLKKLSFASSFVDEIVQKKSFVGIEKTQYCDDKKVTDHYAIIPTGQTQAYDSLTSLQKSVYELIVKRFLSIFFPPAEYEFLKLTTEIDKESFFTSAKALVNPGYLAVAGIPKEKESEDDENTCTKEELLSFAKSAKKGDEILVQGFEIKEGKTSPPKRYTSGTLILAMENAGNLIEDEELREQIKSKGIGTSATRGEILDKLVRIKYLNQNPKNQIITPENLGEMIYEVINMNVPSLLNPEMTANWEMGLQGIENGTINDGEYRLKLEDYIRRNTDRMKEADLTRQIANNIHEFTGKDSKGIATRKSLGLACPICGGDLTTTAFGFGCSNYFNKEKPCRFSIGQIAGKDISEEDFRTLISEGKTPVLDGFVSKSKKTFKAALVLQQSEDGQLQVAFSFDDVPTEYVEGLNCPVCHSRMCKTGFGYTCEKNTGEERTCYFSIGEIAGKSLDIETVSKLINEGSTDIISGFKSKNKNSFKAKLLLQTGEDGKKNITFDFSDIEPDYLEGAVCPDCGGRISIKQTGFGCEKFNANDPASCKFYIGKIAQKQLSAANVKELLNEKKTTTIRGFKSKAGKRFDACLVLNTNEEGKHIVSFDFENVEQKTLKDVKCPLCNEGEIVKTNFGYGCSNYNKDDKENSCTFNVGKIAGVKLNDTQVTALIKDGITPIISGFKSKKGSKFDGCLALDKDDEGKIKGIKFVFPEIPDVEVEGVVCPKCGQPILKGRNGYKCKNYSSQDENGCKFFLGRIAGVDLSPEQAMKLLKEKKSDIITGFLSKKGMYFDAALKVDENGNIVFDFDNNSK